MKILIWTIFQSFLMISVTCSCNQSQYNQFMKRCQQRFVNRKKLHIFNNIIPSSEEDIFVLTNCLQWVGTTFPQCWNTLHWIFSNRKFFDTHKCLTMCHIIRQSCAMLEQFSSMECFSGCFNTSSLPIKNQYCPAVKKKLVNSTISECNNTLIDTSEHSLWAISWKGGKYTNNKNKGCSLTCDSSYQVFKSGQLQVDGPIITFSVLGLFASLFTIMSFLIDWKSQNRYPALILFIMNACSAFCLLGWLVQFVGVGNRISCNTKKLRRYSEPRSSNSFWCVLSFLLIYCSSMAWCCWFAFLNYSWFISFRTMGSIKTLIQGKIKYFHFVSWGITIGFALVALLVQSISAHPVTDICFVNSEDLSMRDSLVTLPITVCVVIGEFFLLRSLFQLRKLQMDCREFLVSKAVRNLSSTLNRMLVYGIGTFLSILLIGFLFYYEKNLEGKWKTSHTRYIRCVLEQSRLPGNSSSCKKPDAMKLLALYTQLFVIFFITILTSSWTWNRGTLRIWKKVWKKHFGEEEEVKKLFIQKNWYRRIHNKKISPFLPPINLDNPLEENNFEFLRRRRVDNKRFSLPNEALSQRNNRNRHRERDQTGASRKRNNSEDIRSVAELFSIRRNTACSLHSFNSTLNSSKNNNNEVSLLPKSNSIQSFGHLSIAREIKSAGASNNLTVVQVHNGNNSKQKFNGTSDSNCYLDEFIQLRNRLYTPVNVNNGTDSKRKRDVRGRFIQHNGNDDTTIDDIIKIRDRLYTPLTNAHRDSVVADCVPYERNDVDVKLISSAVELRKALRSRASYNTLNRLSLSSTEL